MSEQILQKKEKLIGIGDLFRSAWRVYINKIIVLAGIAVVPGIFYSFLQAISGLAGTAGVSSRFLFFLVQFAIFPLSVCGLAINVLANSALVFAIIAATDKNEVVFDGIKKYFAIAWVNFFPYVWVSFLSGIFIFSGFFLFIIPGIVFFIWFAFPLFVFANERIKGMGALFRSKQLARGYWGKIFWRFLALFLILFIAIAFVNYISEKIGISFLGNIFNILATPFILVFDFLIYNDLKRLKEGTPFIAPDKKTKTKFILICSAGVLIMIIIISAFVVLSYNPLLLWKLIT